MLFSDMTQEQRATWLEWARSHNWCNQAVATATGDSVYIISFANGSCYRAYNFSSSYELLNWAGY